MQVQPFPDLCPVNGIGRNSKIALALKENGIALIIGTKTSGQLLSAKKFRIDNNLNIFIPLNNYISYLGYKVDKKGVEPNITIKGSDIDDYIIKHIALNND